jgi:AcrR family transcriptional regulator
MPKRTEPKATQERLPLTKERVLRAAADFADRHGIELLSMRKLGELLGVEAMSLYRHVKNKDEVLDGIVDLVVGEFALPPKGVHWKRALRERAVSAHEVLMRHPWATMLLVSRMNVGPTTFRYLDATIGCLLQAGFSIPMADHANDAMDSYIHGFTLRKLNFPLHPDEYASASAAFLPMIPQTVYPHMYALSKAVAEGRHDGINQLEFGLDLILDGLEKLLEAQRPATKSPRSARKKPVAGRRS